MRMRKKEVGILTLLACLCAMWYFQQNVESEDKEEKNTESLKKPEAQNENKLDTPIATPKSSQSDIGISDFSAGGIEPPNDLKRPLPAQSQSFQSRQQAVEEWEEFIANFPEDENTDYLAMSALVKEKFNRMHPVDRIEPLRRALLLLSDTQYIAVIDILTDNEQSSEVVMAIFDDILHRQDELKIPVLEILKNDKDNAASFEATRILDIIQDSAEPE